MNHGSLQNTVETQGLLRVVVSSLRKRFHPRSDQNREYLVTAMSHDLESGTYKSGVAPSSGPTYACAFTAIQSRQPFRPARVTPKPIVQGPQTAIVVGKSGEEIWTDKYGRVKVQFHWDRYGKSDENSSCWVRVAQVWAGAKCVVALPGASIRRRNVEVATDTSR